MKRESESKTFDKVMDGLLAVPYKELQQKIDQENRAKAQKKKRAKASPSSRASAARKS